MKAKVKYSLISYDDIIDLTDYGYDENVKFEDLTEDEKHQIEDNLREQKIIIVNIES